MRIFLAAALCMLAFQTTDQSQSTPALTHKIVLPGEVKWQSGAPTSHAVMLGNPDNPGLFMTLVKAQDGATLRPHWHSRDENVIVLSGTFLVGFGDILDEHALQAIPAGGYLFIPANVHHFCKTKGETVWEVFGEGPLTHTLLPAPEMQRLAKMLVGKWKVEEDFAPGGDTMPDGGKGNGHSVIEPGAGEYSLIENLVSNSPAAHLYSLIWWEKAGKVFRMVDCDDFSEEACTVENGRGRWEGNEVVWQLTVPKDGKDVPAKIVWAEKDSRSFAATMYVADASGTLKRDWTFLHTRE